MNSIIALLKHQINEVIAVMITSGNYDKNFYEGKLVEVNDNYITLELYHEQSVNFDYDHFILATPLSKYH